MLSDKYPEVGNEETMNQRMAPRIAQKTAFILTCTILVGCTSTASHVPSTTPPVLAKLTAIATQVQFIRTSGSVVRLQKDQSEDILAKDQITVLAGGHGLLGISNRLHIDILRDSDLTVTEIKEEFGGAIKVTLKQVRGHSRIFLTDNSNARVTLETDFASITTQRPETEFVICHDPSALTCLVVFKGEVEVITESTIRTIKEGEATYILKGEVPVPPICADVDAVRIWYDNKLGVEPIAALGELVSGWRAQSCSALTQGSPNATMTTEVVISPTATGVPDVTILDSTAKPILPSAENMIKVHAGTYTIGQDPTDPFHAIRTQREIEEFWIDIYEVTSLQYKKFIDDTGYPRPASFSFLGREHHPVSGISWDNAVAYCTWAHKRLPNEAEWEAAARGPLSDPPLFPWGSDPSAKGQISNLPQNDTYEVGAMPFNKSYFGVFDMAGNLWEWVGDPYNPISGDFKILRGGRYGLIKDMAYRQLVESANIRFIPFAGFRCAADNIQPK